MSKLFVLSHLEARKRAAQFIAEAPEGFHVRISPPPKTRDQEKLVHSCYRDLAAHAQIDGKRATDADWKAKLKADFFDETGNDPEYAEDWRGIRPTLTPVPGTRFVVMSEIHTSSFPRRLYRAYITYVHATGDALGVQWSPTSLGRDAVPA